MFSDISDSLDEGSMAALLLLDLSAAFTTVETTSWDNTGFRQQIFMRLELDTEIVHYTFK